jgi:hypothetical protein
VSIYATLGQIKVPTTDWARDEGDWVEVYFQGVPGHIGHPKYYEADYYADFLPPPVQDEDQLRAVVVLMDGGDEKEVQRYVRPLMTLTGDEWDGTPFPILLRRIEDAVRERLHRLPTAESTNSAGLPEGSGPLE